MYSDSLCYPVVQIDCIGLDAANCEQFCFREIQIVSNSNQARANHAIMITRERSNNRSMRILEFYNSEIMSLSLHDM